MKATFCKFCGTHHWDREPCPVKGDPAKRKDRLAPLREIGNNVTAARESVTKKGGVTESEAEIVTLRAHVAELEDALADRDRQIVALKAVQARPVAAAEVKPGKRGRPKKGGAATAADRMREYRRRQREAKP